MLEVSKGLGDAEFLVILDSLFHTVGQLHGDVPAKVLLGLGRVEQDGLGVVRVAFALFSLGCRVELHGLDGLGEELGNGEVGTGRDVVCAAFALAVQSQDSAVHEVLDIDEVTAGIHGEAAFVLAQAMVEGR